MNKKRKRMKRVQEREKINKSNKFCKNYLTNISQEDIIAND